LPLNVEFDQGWDSWSGYFYENWNKLWATFIFILNKFLIGFLEMLRIEINLGFLTKQIVLNC